MNILITEVNGQLGNEMSIVYGNYSCDILPCRSVEFQSPVERPAYSFYDKMKKKSAFDNHIPHWRKS